MPEIDKLIAISRYFGVSIGALLGVEEETADAPKQDGELTEIGGGRAAGVQEPGILPLAVPVAGEY